MILCITPNPALDRNLSVPGFNKGEVCRSSSLVLSAGGKGVNVARAVRCLGGEASCVGILGGHTGKHHAELVEQEGISGYWTWIDQETRAAVIVNDPLSGEMTVINENGPQVSLPDWERFKQLVLDHAVVAEAVCFCGSLPTGIPPNEVFTLISSIHNLGCRVWVDTSKKYLDSAIQAKPLAIKVNQAELAWLFGVQELSDELEIIQAAKRVLNYSIGHVIVTLGKEGAISLDGREAWKVTPPEIAIVSPIGSGDSFLAGLVTATLASLPESEALKTAAAAGTANALTTGAGNFNKDDFNRILSSVSLKKIF